VEGRPLDEGHLIERAADGDLAAFTQLVQRHQAMAFRVAYLVVGDRTEAEDVAQDAFIKAHAALGRFRRDAPFRPWLLRIVRNEALNRRRRQGRQERLQLRVAGEPVSGDAAPSPETVVLEREDRLRVLAAVEALDPRHREVVAHRYLLGLSESETAQTLGIPVGTVKSRTARALARLERLLAEVVDDG
jgi:RNA polymerase sigma factor (sigma-70 family)